MKIVRRIRTEYGQILCISPYSVQIRGNTDQKNSEYGQVLRSDLVRGVFKTLSNIYDGAFWWK